MTHWKKDVEEAHLGYHSRMNENTSPRHMVAALGRRLHVLADFLIGAHALVQADCILSRDLGVYKTYFSDLTMVGSI
jgi:hypothetical protein